MGSSPARSTRKGKVVMLYDLTVTTYVKTLAKAIEANSTEEAEDILRRMVAEMRQRFSVIDPLPDVKGYVKVSTRNYTYIQGAIYLVSRYSSQVPVVCTRTYYHSIRNSKHTFRYFDTKRHFTLVGPKPHRRILKELCLDGDITKSECFNCVAKFRCFTNKNERSELLAR